MLVCLDLRSGSGCGKMTNDGSKFCPYCGARMRVPLILRNTDDHVGSYTITQIVGYGNFGAVYKAVYSHSPTQTVALKQTFDPNSVHSFQNEFAVLHQLRHPNLPYYIEMFEEDGDGYLVMEFVAGQSLEDIITSQHKVLAETQIVGYGLQLCDVLQYLHSQSSPIFHRDIKPANVRLTSDNQVKLVDFGILKQGTNTTRTSRRALTPAYAPIEQWGGGQSTNAQSDIYSLGATLYHLLTGLEPPTAPARISATKDPLVPPCQLVPVLSTHVSDAVVKAMALAQKDRFADVRSFKQALDGSLFSSSTNKTSRIPQMGSRVASQTQSVSPQAATTSTIRLSSAIRLPSANPKMTAILPHEGRYGSEHMRKVVYSPDAQTLVTATREGTVRLWQVSNHSQQASWHGGSFDCEQLAFSPGGEILAIGGGIVDGKLHLMRASDAYTELIIDEIPGAVKSIAFSSDGKLLAIGTRNNIVQVRATSDLKLLHTFWGHSSAVEGVGFVQNDQVLVSADYHEVRLWNVLTGQFVRSLDAHKPLITSPDGEYVATSREIWRTVDWKKIQNVRLDEQTAFSYDWQTVAQGDYSGKVELRQVKNNQLLSALEYTKKSIKSIAYSPDGSTLAVAHDDAVLLWRL
jgi:serine/threonine protein kinase